MEKVPAGMPPGRCAKEFRIHCGQPVIRPGTASLPRPLWTPLTSCFPNCKIEFCSMISQFCRCGGLFDAKGNPDGFLSHDPSLRNLRLDGILDGLTRKTSCTAQPCRTFLLWFYYGIQFSAAAPTGTRICSRK